MIKSQLKKGNSNRSLLEKVRYFDVQKILKPIFFESPIIHDLYLHIGKRISDINI